MAGDCSRQEQKVVAGVLGSTERTIKANEKSRSNRCQDSFPLLKRVGVLKKPSGAG